MGRKKVVGKSFYFYFCFCFVLYIMFLFLIFVMRCVNWRGVPVLKYHPSFVILLLCFETDKKGEKKNKQPPINENIERNFNAYFKNKYNPNDPIIINKKLTASSTT